MGGGGFECEPKAVTHYPNLQSDVGGNNKESDPFPLPVYCFLEATPDRLVTDPTSFTPEGISEVRKIPIGKLYQSLFSPHESFGIVFGALLCLTELESHCSFFLGDLMKPILRRCIMQ